MKQFNFKKFKFSTILNYINFKRYNYIKNFQIIDFKKISFNKIYRGITLPKIIAIKFSKYLYNLKKLNLLSLLKYLNPQTYVKLFNSIKYLNNKFLFIHLPTFTLFFGFLYLFIPIFYNYEKASIENLICKSNEIECQIKGKVKYNFYPTPRIIIKNLEINDFFQKNKVLIKSKSTIVKLSFKNLLVKEKQKFKKILIKNYEVNFDLENLNKLTKALDKKIIYVPVILKKGTIVFFKENNYVASIKNAKLDLNLNNNFKKLELNGKFLNDDLIFKLDSKPNKKGKIFKDILLKMSDLNLITKINILESNDKDMADGNITIKKDKQKFTAIFSHKKNEILISGSNFRNPIVDGKLAGKIKISPYFNFDLDLSLNSINLTKLNTYFLSLDDTNQKNFFRINKKVNGKLSLSANKIYSKYNLTKSFESNIEFINGNILIERFLINLGKLGAADLVGTINNEKKFSHFKYESNIFIDNEKKFLSKFAIYNKKNIPTNIFISGNFDLQNIRKSFYEISHKEKLKDNDVNFIEQEFNDLMLVDNYKSLFIFSKFKEFIKSINTQ